MKYSELTKQFLDMLHELQQLYDAYTEQYRIKTGEKEDLNHAIEDETHCKARNRLSTQLHLVRRERRKAENFCMSYKAVNEYLLKNKSVVDRLGRLLELLRKAETPKHREYIPRVRPDYFDGSWLLNAQNTQNAAGQACAEIPNKTDAVPQNQAAQPRAKISEGGKTDARQK